MRGKEVADTPVRPDTAVGSDTAVGTDGTDGSAGSVGADSATGDLVEPPTPATRPDLETLVVGQPPPAPS